MLQGNPKMLLADSPLFHGLTQHQLPFSVSPLPPSPEPHYQARIRLPLPDGKEAWGLGVARTKKEAERLAAVDACKKLNALGFLVGVSKSNLASPGWGDNPKNTLVTSIAFRDICCGGNARALPISLRASGPDHAKVFVAELSVPLPTEEKVFVAVGQGRNKAEAERACCMAACEKLHQEGLLKKPGVVGGGTVNAPAPCSSKAVQIQQQNEQPAIVGLHDEELIRMEDALQRLHMEMQENDNARRNHQASALQEVHNNCIMQREELEMTTNFVSREQLATENDMLRLEAIKRRSSSEYKEQRQKRESLPSWKERENIIHAIHNNQVVVLKGETGCGKTTQVPQFVLEDRELMGAGAEVHIVVTQPRRIAAISVAERVAWERGEPLGKSVGYTIRLESVPPRSRGSILYCTTGILLRRLQNSDGLSGVTHIIIDEVHERDLETDFLLVVVHELLEHHKFLHVVIMSATLDASIYTRYFNDCPVVSIPGMIHPVQVYFKEDLAKLTGQYRDFVTWFPKPGILDDDDVDVDLVINVLSWIVQEFAEGDGAILCFLPGWDNIAAVRDRLLKLPSSRHMMVVPLHSQLPSGEQRAAFTRAPSGLRKIVLATNIAETSVTIDDVVYVVDSGKIKERQFDPSRNMTTMRVQWTSQASARQRQGRAGRVRAGFCFRLYTKQIFYSMSEHQIPEMHRVPLEELCLQIKAFSTPSATTQAIFTGTPRPSDNLKSALSDIASFLSKALQPPKGHAVHAAIKVLRELGAIDEHENLTTLGTTLSKLAVHPRFGKMLVYGALLGCLGPLLTIASAACFRDPFLAPVNKRVEADRVRESFAVHSYYGSDHLALVNAFEQWLKACLLGQGHAFCEQNFLAPLTMKLIAGTRERFEKTLAEAGILKPLIRSSPQASAHMARCLLASGLYPNIARSEICRESKGLKNATKHAYRWRLGFKVFNGRVFLHPTSVVSEKQLNPESHYYLVFQEKVQTSQVFVRGCTLLPPLAIVFLGWNVCVSHDPTPSEISCDWMLLEVEGWLKFSIHRRAGSLLLQLREAFDKVLGRWVSGSIRTNAECHLVNVVVSLLQATCNDMFLNSG